MTTKNAFAHMNLDMEDGERLHDNFERIQDCYNQCSFKTRGELVLVSHAVLGAMIESLFDEETEDMENARGSQASQPQEEGETVPQQSQEGV